MQHELAQIAEIIARLNLHYPRNGGLTNAQIAVLAEDWAEDLADWTMPVIRQAARLCRHDERRRYFPTIGEMRIYCRTAHAEMVRQSGRRALPAPEHIDMERNKRGAQAILDRLRRQAAFVREGA